MSKSLVMKLVTAIAVVAVVGAVGVFLANRGGNVGGNGGGANDAATIGAGVSTSVACEEIAATRGLVNTELAERKSAAANMLGEEMETASDNYWEKRRAPDAAKTACESEALLADPCKALFERSSALAQQILNNIDNGFDQAKFDEREQVKAEYDECLENPPEEDTYPGKLEECMAAFNAGNEAALAQRAAEEAAAQTKHDDFVKEAESQHASKMGALDALEKECEDTKYERKYGSLPGTGIPVTDYQGGSSACTGVFPGNDPDIQRQLSNLRSQYNKAKAAGKTTGFMSTSQLDQAIKDLEAEMAAGEAKCTTDADCGGPTPVCCNISEIAHAFCSDGVCASEKTQCATDEVCAGDPAQCMALVQVIEYQGSLLPTSALRIGEIHPPDEHGGCDDRHWHADIPVTALDGTIKKVDPLPNACGFGRLSDKPAFKVYPSS